MDENHQNKANHNLTTIEDVEWVLSKKSKLLIPQHKNQSGGILNVPFDWLNLIGVLLIPFVVTVIGLYATQQITQQQIQSSQEQHQTDIQISESQHQTDIDIAQDQQREMIFETYIAGIQDLLLNDKLRESKSGEEVRVVARARTLAVLRELDSQRQRLLVLFLYEANLINKNAIIINLNGADLSGVNFVLVKLNNISLSGAYIVNANFASANLRGVDLSNADLYGVDFSGADLAGANLRGAIVSKDQLVEASSLKGAIMPDSSIHP